MRADKDQGVWKKRIAAEGTVQAIAVIVQTVTRGTKHQAELDVMGHRHEFWHG